MLTITKYLFIITYLNISNVYGMIVKQPDIPLSPCPDKFLYKFDSNWFGDIQIGPMNYNLGYAMIQINFILNRTIPDKSYVKGIMLQETNDTIIDKIKNGTPVNYRVYFPFNDMLPELTAIMLNGETICSAPENPIYKSFYFLRHNVSWPTVTRRVIAPNNHNNGILRSIPRPILSPNALPLKIEIPNDIPSSQRFESTNSGCGIIDNQNYNPWLVGIFEQKQYRFICSGSLISNRHIITAAHCIPPSEIMLKLGSNDATAITEPDIILRYSKSIHFHSDYDPDSYYADLSIILLNEEVAISPKIRPICLWPKQMAEIPIIGKSAQLIGWEINQNGFSNNIPLRTNIIVNPLDECNIFDSKYLSDMSICTSDETQRMHPCSVYPGSSLIFSLNNRHTLKAVMTITNSELNPNVCDSFNKYSIFTDISKYSDWINLILRLS